MPAAKRRQAGEAQQQAQATAGVVELHRSRFVEWQPAAVVALAASGDGSVLAAAREDGAIELYETATTHCFQRLPGHKDSCLTCLALVDEEDSKGGLSSRLFSDGLDGVLVEWDVEGRRPTGGVAEDSLGGAVWQLAPEPGASIAAAGGSARIAAACDDGCARIFVAEAGVPGLRYSRSLPRVEGRTLAVAWHPSGDVLATAGTDGCIHMWSVSAGRELLRITAGDGSGGGGGGGEGGEGGCIWALLVLPDGTVVSGDSSGNVQFWDGRFGTLLARFTQHRADVLQLAASPDGDVVFASGVDPQVALFHRLPLPAAGEYAASSDAAAAAAEEPVGSGKALPWAYLSTKRPHSHDVRALVVASGKALPPGEGGPRLFTGGNDTQLVSHSVLRFLKEHPVKVDPSPQLPVLQTARPLAPAGGGAEQPPPLLLCAQRTEVDVWQLGEAGGSAQMGPPAEGTLLAASEPPEHLLRLVVQSGRHVSAAALAPDGRWLAYSDAQRCSCVALEQRAADDLVPDSDYLMPLPLQLPADLPPACQLAFRPGTDQLVAAAADGTLRVVDCAACPRQQSGAEAAAAAAAADGGVVAVLRAVHDLQYKSWLRRDKQRSAARRLMPLIELMAISPDGSWLAVVVRQRVMLLSLATHKLVHTLPPLADPQPALTAVAFTADSAAVVVAASTHQVAAYDVQTGQPTQWTQQHSSSSSSGGLPAKLLRMPGSILSIASCPAAPLSLFLQSAEACCHLDMTQPLEPAGEDQQQQQHDRKRRRSQHRAAAASEPPGGNCRMLYCADPVLHASYLTSDALLVVERPWEQVFKKIAAPMYRHRYGT